jgi:mannose-6-phosphate isomerase-like protein (cupin superfamily)
MSFDATPFTATVTILVGSAVLAVSGCQFSPRETRPIVLRPDDANMLWVFPDSENDLGRGGELGIFIDAHTHPHARASFATFTLGVGGELPVHRHDKTEEFAYIISGEGAAVAVGDDGQPFDIPIAAGYVWYNPPGVWHAFRNTGSEPVSLVFATVPNEKQGLLSFFRRVCSEPGEPGTPISTKELVRIGTKHDVIFHEDAFPDDE